MQGVKEGARCKVQGVEGENVRRRAFGVRGTIKNCRMKNPKYENESENCR